MGTSNMPLNNMRGHKFEENQVKMRVLGNIPGVTTWNLRRFLVILIPRVSIWAKEIGTIITKLATCNKPTAGLPLRESWILLSKWNNQECKDTLISQTPKLTTTSLKSRSTVNRTHFT